MIIFNPFELTGQYAGFVFTEAGKRRMLLRQGETEHLLKVPRAIRHRVIGKFRPGNSIRVAGTEEQEPGTGALKRVVSRVLPEGFSPNTFSPSAPVARPATVIEVCAKKNCWRKGGRELWEALARELDASGHAGSITLREVGCLDRCKDAPNLDAGGCAYTCCSHRNASAIITRAVASRSRDLLVTGCARDAENPR